MMLSETVMMPSETVRVNSTAVSSETLGTVKDGVSVESSSDMDKVESCDHEYVRLSSGSASVAVPARVTVSPSDLLVGSGVHCWSRVNAVGDGNYDAV